MYVGLIAMPEVDRPATGLRGQGNEYFSKSPRGLRPEEKSQVRVIFQLIVQRKNPVQLSVKALAGQWKGA